MKLLVLGGTRFLGRHLAEQALAAGHAVTLLHRGRGTTGLLPEAEHRLADRDGDLTAALAGGAWDAAIDTSAYVPRQVRAAAAALAGRVGTYQLVSTISVYRAFDQPGLTEDTPLATLDDPATEVVDGATYGGLKALCERALQDALPGRADIVRPGLIVGPHDPTGRFSWWVERLQRGGDVLCPGTPDDAVQFIDARDLAAFMLARVQGGAAGVVHASGPAAPLTMGALLETARAVLNPEARLHWVASDFLLAEGVVPWTEVPLWLPPDSANLHRIDPGRALVGGLVCRPLAETLLDTAAWLARAAERVPASTAGPARPSIGLDADKERRLLAAFRARGPVPLQP
jgi:2'-hydroxyisoflavone reductase